MEVVPVNRRIVLAFAFFLMVVGNFSLAIPVLCKVLPDYGSIIRADWTVDTLTGKTQYRILRPKSVYAEGLKAVGFGTQTLATLWILGLSCMILLWTVIALVDERPEVTVAWRLILVHAWITLANLSVALAAALLHPLFSSVKEHVRYEIPDHDAMLSAVVVYEDILISVVVDMFLVLAVFNVLGFLGAVGSVYVCKRAYEWMCRNARIYSLALRGHLLGHIGLDPLMILLRPDDRVDVLSVSLRWKKLIPRLTGKVLASTDRENLIRILSGDMARKILDQFGNAVRSSSAVIRRNAASEVFDDAMERACKRTQGMAEVFTQDALRSNEERFSGDDGLGLARSILRGVTARKVEKLRGDIAADIDQTLEVLLEKFLEDTLEEMRRPIFAFGGLSDQRAFYGVFPQGTRFFETKASHLVYVVEFPPQVRSVFFDRLFLQTEYPWYFGSQSGDISRLRPVRLAFPYVVCFISLIGSRLESFKVFYRNEPLRSMDDILLKTNLPNTHSDCGVCMNTRASISVSAEEVLESFWTGTFNTDLKVHNYDPAKSLSPRIRNLREWVVASGEDPAFVLTVPWQPSGKTVSDIVNDIMGEARKEMNDRFDRMVQGILDRKQGSFGLRVRDHIDSIKADAFFEQSVEDALRIQLGLAERAFIEGLSQRLRQGIEAVWLRGQIENSIGVTLEQLLSKEMEMILANIPLKLEGPTEYSSIVTEIAKRMK